jgi:hypothetical protein
VFLKGEVWVRMKIQIVPGKGVDVGTNEVDDLRHEV